MRRSSGCSGPDPEIRKVIREERRRGRRPVDEEQVAENKRLERDFLYLLETGNEKDFRAFLNAHGLQDGQEKFDECLKLWRDYQKRETCRRFSP